MSERVSEWASEWVLLTAVRAAECRPLPTPQAELATAAELSMHLGTVGAVLCATHELMTHELNHELDHELDDEPLGQGRACSSQAAE